MSVSITDDPLPAAGDETAGESQWSAHRWGVSVHRESSDRGAAGAVPTSVSTADSTAVSTALSECGGRIVVSCDSCPFTSSYSSAGHARRALGQHSCARQLAKAAARKDRARREAAVDRTPQPCHHKVADHQHGTRACYVLDRCRCLPCAAANNTAADEWRRAKLYGRYDKYVDAEPARRHVLDLSAAGMGLRRVAEVSGVGRGTLASLLHGKYRDRVRHEPSRRITRAVADRILAVRFDPAAGTPADAAQTDRARRRLRALVALGWSITELGDRLGIGRSNMRPVIGSGQGSGPGSGLHTGQRLLQHKTIAKIDALYAELSMTLPPATNQRDRISVSRAKNYARERGWVPPLDIEADLEVECEDDEDLEEVDGQYGGGPYLDEQAIWRRLHGDRTVRLTRAEREEAVRRWQASGRSLNELGRDTGWNVHRDLRAAS